MYLILRWLLNSLSLILIAYIVPGFEVKSFWTALLAALFLGIINAVIRPMLIILTLPINILTLGLFTFIINALMFWLVASFLKGFEIAGFWSAFLAALIFWLITWLTNTFIEKSNTPKYLSKQTD